MLFNMEALEHVTYVVVEELDFKFYLILINLNISHHMWAVTTILDRILLCLKPSDHSGKE